MLTAATLMLFDVGGIRTWQEEESIRRAQRSPFGLSGKTPEEALRNLKTGRPLMLFPFFLIGLVLVVSAIVEFRG